MEAWVSQTQQLSALFQYIKSRPQPTFHPIMLAGLSTQLTTDLGMLVGDVYDVLLHKQHQDAMQEDQQLPSTAEGGVDLERVVARQAIAALSDEGFDSIVLALTTYMYDSVSVDDEQLPSLSPTMTEHTQHDRSPLVFGGQGLPSPLQFDRHTTAPRVHPWELALSADLSQSIALNPTPQLSGPNMDLYRGHYNGQPVAVKVVRVPFDLRRASIFDKCFREMPNVGHPNLAPYIGVYATGGMLGLVRPWLHENVLGNLFRDPRKDYLPILFKVADALAILHEGADAVHGGIRPSQVLLTESGDVLLCDTGARRVAQRLHSPLRLTADDYRYMAPELSSSSAIATKFSDVYAFAMLAAQLADRELRVPFHRHEELAEVITAVADGERPSFHSESDTLNGLMREAWDKVPTARPSMREICNTIGRALSRRSTACTSCGTLPCAQPIKKSSASQLSSPPSSPVRNSLGLDGV
ncbi:kinase-like domain-containing protein [Auriculariales sp. MPI-PUGE-AT-0066]|nr:kinase-like domain-containing protein [Auriculariales sp. MPI-PUGE-AT-0066]